MDLNTLIIVIAVLWLAWVVFLCTWQCVRQEVDQPAHKH